MQEPIDFLPARYRERVQLRRTVVWQAALVAVFGCAIVGTAIWKIGQRSAVAAQLAAITTDHERAIAKRQQQDELNGKLQAARDASALYIYLQHPWPKSQLLHHAAAPLPESIQLLTLRITDQLDQPDNIYAQPPRSAKDELATQPTAADDLTRLRDEHDERRPVIELTGVATNPAELHLYIAALDGVELFESATLESIEALTGEQASGSRFELRLRVRPGYGQPGGPSLPAVAAQPALGENAS